MKYFASLSIIFYTLLGCYAHAQPEDPRSTCNFFFPIAVAAMDVTDPYREKYDDKDAYYEATQPYFDEGIEMLEDEIIREMTSGETYFPDSLYDLVYFMGEDALSMGLSYDLDLDYTYMDIRAMWIEYCLEEYGSRIETIFQEIE